MTSVDPNVICASVEVSVAAERAFAFMADGMKQDHFALGSVNRRALEDGIFVGENSFDGSHQYVKLEAHQDLLLIDALAGDSPEKLLPHVEIRILRGSWLGKDDEVSVVVMTIWRNGEDDSAWDLQYHIWRTEMHLIKGAIERGL